jgi:hypothetical protein
MRALPQWADARSPGRREAGHLDHLSAEFGEVGGELQRQAFAPSVIKSV